MLSVIKIGGSVLEPEPDPALLASLVAAARDQRLVLVHGGGKTLTRLLARLGIAAEFRRGLRVTTPATLAAAVMALAGEVNTSLVARLNHAGLPAVGLSGVAGDCLLAAVADPALGRVGAPVGGNPAPLRALLAAGFTPVLASIASDGAGGALNVNADLFAAQIAALLSASRLLFMTDAAGVLDASGQPIPRLRLSELRALETAGAVSGGMLPKLDACRLALAAGVAEVVIAAAGHVQGTQLEL